MRTSDVCLYLSLLALALGVLFMLLALRQDRRDWLNYLANADNDLKLDIPPLIPATLDIGDRVRDHRMALIDGFMGGSALLLEDGDPRWKSINDQALAMLDWYIHEYPYDEKHPAIDHITINAALNSQRRTITNR